MARGYMPAGGSGGTGSDECTALLSDVIKGKKAVTADSGDEAGTGTLELTGTAADDKVLSGSTYYSTDPKTKKTGTMVNKGSTTTAATSSVDASNKRVVLAVPANGYYNTSSKLYDTYGNIASRIGLTAAKLAYNQSALGLTGTYKGLGNAVQANVIKGKTFSTASLSNATGTLAIQSAINFSAAALSPTSIRISWKNPSKGPYQGVTIRMSTSGYPGTSGGTVKYSGTGSSAAASATSYVDITGLTPGTTYYFTCVSWVTNLGYGTSYNVSAKTNATLTLGAMANAGWFPASYALLFNGYQEPPHEDDWAERSVWGLSEFNNVNVHGENGIYAGPYYGMQDIIWVQSSHGGNWTPEITIALLVNTKEHADECAISIKNRYSKINWEWRSKNSISQVGTKETYTIKSVTSKGLCSSIQYRIKFGPYNSDYVDVYTHHILKNYYVVEIKVNETSLPNLTDSGMYYSMYFYK